MAAGVVEVADVPQAPIAGTESMTEQNRQRSSSPRVDSARSTMARATSGSAAAEIIVP